MNNIKRNIFGINIEELHIKMRSDFVINKGNNIYFQPNEDGQLDFLVYLTLIDNVNCKNIFDINLIRFVEKMGYKSNPRAGKINSKVMESIKRLDKIKLLKLQDCDGKFIAGNLINFNQEEECFEVDMYDICRILEDSKYSSKPKVIYLYSYIIASNYKNNNLNIGILSRDCGLSTDFVLKCLDQFHEDGLIDKSFISTSRIIKEEDKPYVYIHINKLNGEVLYVGKGRNERYCDLKSRNSKYTSFISEIGEDNIECKIIDYFDNDYSAYVYEYEIVSKYRAIGQAKHCIVLGNLEIKDGQ